SGLVLDAAPGDVNLAGMSFIEAVDEPLAEVGLSRRGIAIEEFDLDRISHRGAVDREPDRQGSDAGQQTSLVHVYSSQIRGPQRDGPDRLLLRHSQASPMM